MSPGQITVVFLDASGYLLTLVISTMRYNHALSLTVCAAVAPA